LIDRRANAGRNGEARDESRRLSACVRTDVGDLEPQAGGGVDKSRRDSLDVVRARRPAPPSPTSAAAAAATAPLPHGELENPPEEDGGVGVGVWGGSVASGKRPCSAFLPIAEI
jgi:hypothetical protein